jgi:hypothetical protein
MGALPKSGDDVFYIPWVRGNENIDHLNIGLKNGLKIGAIYQGQG